jgi:hypothetical protein
MPGVKDGEHAPALGVTINGLCFVVWPDAPNVPGHWRAMTAEEMLALGARMVAEARRVLDHGPPSAEEVVRPGADAEAKAAREARRGEAEAQRAERIAHLKNRVRERLAERG